MKKFRGTPCEKSSFWPIWPWPLTLSFICLDPSWCRCSPAGAIWVYSIGKWKSYAVHRLKKWVFGPFDLDLEFSLSWSKLVSMLTCWCNLGIFGRYMKTLCGTPCEKSRFLLIWPWPSTLIMWYTVFKIELLTHLTLTYDLDLGFSLSWSKLVSMLTCWGNLGIFGR